MVHRRQRTNVSIMPRPMVGTPHANKAALIGKANPRVARKPEGTHIDYAQIASEESPVRQCPKAQWAAAGATRFEFIFRCDRRRAR